MPVTVVVGGQFGSEGKGKVAYVLAREMGATVAIRVGGPNSGHTVIDESGTRHIFRQLPTAAILPDVQCVLPAGSYICVELLLEEMRMSRLAPERLTIDPNAVVITNREVVEEKQSDLRLAIGSTQSGTGAAVAARVNRVREVRLAREEPGLKSFLARSTPLLRDRLSRNQRLIIEGTQGFGLSVLHSPHYPYATSRDTTAASFVSEAGLSPLDVDDIVVVLRSLPIRVPGNSGPLPGELSWEDVTRESGGNSPIAEYTSVTHSLRRIARFDPVIVREAIEHNAPTRIVLNHLDYIDSSCAELGVLTPKAAAFLRKVEVSIRSRVDLVGCGANQLASSEASQDKLELA